MIKKIPFYSRFSLAFFVAKIKIRISYCPFMLFFSDTRLHFDFANQMP